jgi:hypothetical protein
MVDCIMVAVMSVYFKKKKKKQDALKGANSK